MNFTKPIVSNIYDLPFLFKLVRILNIVYNNKIYLYLFFP